MSDRPPSTGGNATKRFLPTANKNQQEEENHPLTFSSSFHLATKNVQINCHVLVIREQCNICHRHDKQVVSEII